MADIANADLELGRVVATDPANGAVSVILASAALASLLGWNPVSGDTLHGAPTGSAGGGGTRRHLFDREVYVDSDGAGAYVNVRAWASLTGVPATFPPSVHSHTYAALKAADGAWPTTLVGLGVTGAQSFDGVVTHNVDGVGALVLGTGANAAVTTTYAGARGAVGYSGTAAFLKGGAAKAVEIQTDAGTVASFSAAGATTLIGALSAVGTIALSGAAATTRGIAWQTAGVLRWQFYADNGAESGADAGSSFILKAYTDAGASIDSVITIGRSAAGTITFGRAFSSLGSGSVTGFLGVTGPVATTRQVLFRTSGSNRWSFSADNGAESGANAGSSFAIAAYSDTAVFIDTPFSIARAAGGSITMVRPLLLTSKLYSTTSVASGTPYAATTMTLTANTTYGALLVGFGTAYDVSLFNRTGALALGVTANTVNVVMAGALTTSGAIAAGGTIQATTFFNVTGAAGGYRGYLISTGAANRWYLTANNGPESGADAGSDLNLLCYNDAGSAPIDAPISITRALGGAMTLTRPTYLGPGVGSKLILGSGASAAYAGIVAGAGPILNFELGDLSDWCDVKAKGGSFTTTLRAGAGTLGGSGTAGDIIARRTATTGAIYFGENGGHYIYWDGTSFNFGAGGAIIVPGNATVNGGALIVTATGLNPQILMTRVTVGQWRFLVDSGGYFSISDITNGTTPIVLTSGGGTLTGTFFLSNGLTIQGGGLSVTGSAAFVNMLNYNGGAAVGAAIATNATTGFLGVPGCPGPPTGAPVAAYNNCFALVYDYVNNYLYVNNGTWKKVLLA